MADIPITALTTAGQLSSSDLLYVAIPNPLSPIGFSLCKMTSAQFGIFLNKDLLFASDLTTDSKNIIGAINELKAGGGGGGGASVIQLTQAEYTALSTAEKMNGSIYKMTDNAKMYCLDEEYHPVKELTTAQYEALTSAEKNNGTIYIQTDAETTGSDIPVATGETETIAEAIDSLDFEEGTSGFFKYRKWNDGTLEIWGTRHATGWTPSWSAWGDGYYTTISSMGTYPVAFIDNPNVQVTFQPKGGQAFAGLTDGNYTNILKQVPVVGVYRFTSDSGSLNEFVLSIYATGRWKA